MLEEDKQEREELLKELYANPKHIREHEICLMLIQLFEEKELSHDGRTYIQGGKYISDVETQKKLCSTGKKYYQHKFNWRELDAKIDALQKAGKTTKEIAEEIKVRYDTLWIHLKKQKALPKRKKREDIQSQARTIIPLRNGKDIVLKVKLLKDKTLIKITIPGEK